MDDCIYAREHITGQFTTIDTCHYLPISLRSGAGRCRGRLLLSSLRLPPIEITHVDIPF